MTVYYRGTRAFITHEVFEVRCPSPRSFAIRELGPVYVVEERTGAPASGLAPARACSSSVAGAAAVAAVMGGPILESPAVSVVAMVLLAASSATWGACVRIRERRYALCAVYRGQPVRLFQTTDARLFGQVRRALLRSTEQITDAR